MVKEQKPASLRSFTTSDGGGVGRLEINCALKLWCFSLALIPCFHLLNLLFGSKRWLGRKRFTCRMDRLVKRSWKINFPLISEELKCRQLNP